MRSHQPDGTEVNGNLPLELDGFVGRRAELQGLAGALDASRLVTVTGSGGIGKSRLAVRVAAGRCAPPDGVWHVGLAAVRDPEFVDYAVVESLGLTDHTTRLPHETLLAHLAGRRLLLVLDGFEHLVDACAALVVDLLGRLPGLAVLAVGRRPLAVAGEQVFALGPLSEDEAAALQGAAASLWPSVGLPLFGSAHYNAPHELCETTARERLGDERYAECVRQGRALGREAAVSRALGRVRPLEGLPAPRGAVRHARVTLHMQQPAASPTRKGGETAG